MKYIITRTIIWSVIILALFGCGFFGYTIFESRITSMEAAPVIEMPTSTAMPTPTVTPTPITSVLVNVYGDYIALRLNAGFEAPVIGWLRKGESVKVLYREEIIGGYVWIEVQDKDGRIGWIPKYVLDMKGE